MAGRERVAVNTVAHHETANGMVLRPGSEPGEPAFVLMHGSVLLCSGTIADLQGFSRSITALVAKLPRARRKAGRKTKPVAEAA